MLVGLTEVGVLWEVGTGMLDGVGLATGEEGGVGGAEVGVVTGGVDEGFGPASGVGLEEGNGVGARIGVSDKRGKKRRTGRIRRRRWRRRSNRTRWRRGRGAVHRKVIVREARCYPNG